MLMDLHVFFSNERAVGTSVTEEYFSSIKSISETGLVLGNHSYAIFEGFNCEL